MAGGGVAGACSPAGGLVKGLGERLACLDAPRMSVGAAGIEHAPFAHTAAAAAAAPAACGAAPASRPLRPAVPCTTHHLLPCRRALCPASQVGISSVWWEGNPCNMHLNDLAAEVKAGVADAGMVGLRFNTIGVSDGISMGTDGMSFSLQSRDIIAGARRRGRGAGGGAPAPGDECPAAAWCTPCPAA